MSAIVKFRLKARPTREQAKQWLAAYVTAFPSELNGGIGPILFHGWRFIVADDGKTYFANCLEPGISEEEFRRHLESA